MERPDCLKPDGGSQSSTHLQGRNRGRRCCPHTAARKDGQSLTWPRRNLHSDGTRPAEAGVGSRRRGKPLTAAAAGARFPTLVDVIYQELTANP